MIATPFIDQNGRQQVTMYIRIATEIKIVLQIQSMKGTFQAAAAGQFQHQSKDLPENANAYERNSMKKETKNTSLNLSAPRQQQSKLGKHSSQWHPQEFLNFSEEPVGSHQLLTNLPKILLSIRQLLHPLSLKNPKYSACITAASTPTT